MVQVLEAGESFGSEIGKALGKGLGSFGAGALNAHIEKKNTRKFEENFKQRTGIDVSGYPPEIQKEFAKQIAKGMSIESVIDRFSRETNAESEVGNQPSRQNRAQPQVDIRKQFMEIVPALEEELGVELQPPQLDKIWKTLESGNYPGGANEEMPPEKEPEQERSPKKLSEKQQMVLDYLAPNISRGQRERENMDQRKFEADRKYHTTRSNKFLDEVQKTTEGARERRIALDSALSAVESGQMSPFGGDFWADVLHAPQLRSESGAQLQAAAKVNLIGSLRKAGARPNQFIEKQISDAFAKPGETKEAQKAKLMMARSVLDLDEQHAELAREIANQDRDKYGYVREDVDSRVEKAIKPYAEEKMRDLAYDLRENMESDMGEARLSEGALKQVPSGTFLTPKMAAVLVKKAGGNEKDGMKLAKALGYEFPSDEMLLRRGYEIQ